MIEGNKAAKKLTVAEQLEARFKILEEHGQEAEAHSMLESQPTLAEDEKARLREQLEQQREFRRQAQNLRWRNPIQDKNADELRGESKSYGTEKDAMNCAFFLKTGACRYGEACSKFHPYPASSSTILIKNMYDGPGMTEHGDEDNDDNLEHSEDEINTHYATFFKDIVPEFRRFGTMEALRVCRNHSFHLRGNVYVLYKDPADAVKAFAAFNGRFYGGRKLILQFSPVLNWKSAVCGLFSKGICERGKACNFLHVFRNPGGQLEGPAFDDDSDEEPSRRDRRDNRDGRDNRGGGRGDYRGDRRDNRDLRDNRGGDLRGDYRPAYRDDRRDPRDRRDRGGYQRRDDRRGEDLRRDDRGDLRNEIRGQVDERRREDRRRDDRRDDRREDSRDLRDETRKDLREEIQKEDSAKRPRDEEEPGRDTKRPRGDGGAAKKERRSSASSLSESESSSD